MITKIKKQLNTTTNEDDMEWYWIIFSNVDKMDWPSKLNFVIQSAP